MTPTTSPLLIDPPLETVPDEFNANLAPSMHILREWQEYCCKLDGCDELRVGSIRCCQKRFGVFRFTLKNQLGKCWLQGFQGGQPATEPLCVEVVSPKLLPLENHIAFYHALVDDLFARASRLPFHFASETSQGVVSSPSTPFPLFVLHFLCSKAAELRTATNLVLSSPYRVLHDVPDVVSIGEASEVDADVLLSVLSTPAELVRAPALPAARRMGGLAPIRVWQRRPEETFDTPENCFVLAFLRQLAQAAADLQRQPWYPQVDPDRRRVVRELAAFVRQAATHPMFAEVGTMRLVPLSSQTLLKREGYRSLLALWKQLNGAQKPIFEVLQSALDLRDVAKLYEIWAFFALGEELAQYTKCRPVIEADVTDEVGLRARAIATFGEHRRLLYNQIWSRGDKPWHSYSVPLRPDFTWVDRYSRTVFDAKFRLESQDFDISNKTQATAPRADLYKMHTYRDALGVDLAVAIYPGDLSVLYSVDGHRHSPIGLGDLLNGRKGIGALAMAPGKTLHPHVEEE